MTNKEKYRILCEKELSIPIYSRDWWLDCACGDKWEVLLYMNEEQIEASMPVYLPNKETITMPVYTQTMGIWFNPMFDNNSYSKNLHRKQVICEYFISCLPSHNHFLQNFHHSFTDWLPFYWKGYNQTTRYTYILPSISNLEEIESNLNTNLKRNLKKAKEKYHLEVKKDIPTDMFLEINSLTYERQGKKAYHPEVLRKLIDTSRKRNQGDIWGAYDEQGKLHAAVFLVWQENCAYYIAGGANPELRKSGAHALVMWKAICELAEISSSFDFEGSMIQGVERFFREFGATQMPYFTLSKGTQKVTGRIKSFLKKKITS